jgi:hypothetical protein
MVKTNKLHVIVCEWQLAAKHAAHIRSLRRATDTVAHSLAPLPMREVLSSNKLLRILK